MCAQTQNTREILVGEVTVMDKLCKVYADISPDSSQVSQFFIEPSFVRLDTWGAYRFVIPVSPSMIEEFNLISQKYKEWSKVAIDNKAVVKKDMEIETPIRKSWEKVSNKVKTFDISIKPYFVYTLKKDPTLAFTVSAHDKFHPNYYSLVFSNPKQLDDFGFRYKCHIFMWALI